MALNKVFKLCKLLNEAKISTNKYSTFKHIRIHSRNFSTTPVCKDLNEFFDDPKNWGQQTVKSGRCWTKDDLRIKSNVDLHKLWYVLLKERNMLLTMEQDANEKVQLFPSPERLDKVEESMENLENVVRERNRAYHELETGVNGERPIVEEINVLGLNTRRRTSEHVVPKHMNKKWNEEHQKYDETDRDVAAFKLKLNEKKYMQKRRASKRDFNHVIGLLNRFPDMDVQALKEQYPSVDIEKAKASRKYRGHFVPK